MYHRGFEAWITDGNQEGIEEYNKQGEEGEGRTASCYIPSESGKQFVIRWKDHGGEQHFSARAYVDGVRTRGKICKPRAGGTRKGVRISADAYRAFQFADLQTTDDDAALGNAANLEKLGTIELRVFHIRAETGRERPFRPRAFTGVGTVHERSKKAGAHCVTLGETIPSGHGRGGTRSCKVLNKKEGPFVTFVWRYRPAALLQAEGILRPTTKKEGKRRASPSNVKSKSEPHGESRVAPAEDIIELSDDDEDVRITAHLSVCADRFDSTTPSGRGSSGPRRGKKT
ncbi:hypothetical protein C2E23DRAFT_192821 [Lenzites betulinus]|nr:hypothetical protein C2E23DRAFT_192821 [Lenzites betulinus]